MQQVRSCKVCLVEHDPDIHEATIRLREWFRERVKRNLYEETGAYEETDTAPNAA